MNRLILLGPILVIGASGWGCGRASSLPALGGTGGAIAEAGATDGLPSDGAVCTDPGAPRTFPWTFSSPDGGAAGVPTRDGGVDAGTSGCQTSPGGFEPNVSCSGGAWLRATSGGPTITWDDGSQLTWNPAGVSQPITPPIGAGMPDQRVWVGFSRQNQVLCPFCGGYEANDVVVRDSVDGPIRFMARQGPTLPEPGTEELTAIFGVDAETVAICTLQTPDGCTNVRRTIDAHVLLTVPAQAIPAGALTRVSAPNGTFDVLWYSSGEESLGLIPNCEDGETAGQPIKFVLSRVSKEPR